MVNLFCAISCIAWKVSRGSCAIPVQACGFHNLFCCTAYSTEGAVPWVLRGDQERGDPLQMVRSPAVSVAIPQRWAAQPALLVHDYVLLPFKGHHNVHSRETCQDHNNNTLSPHHQFIFQTGINRLICKKSPWGFVAHAGAQHTLIPQILWPCQTRKRCQWNQVRRLPCRPSARQPPRSQRLLRRRWPHVWQLPSSRWELQRSSRELRQEAPPHLCPQLVKRKWWAMTMCDFNPSMITSYLC